MHTLSLKIFSLGTKIPYFPKKLNMSANSTSTTLVQFLSFLFWLIEQQINHWRLHFDLNTLFFPNNINIERTKVNYLIQFKVFHFEITELHHLYLAASGTSFLNQSKKWCKRKSGGNVSSKILIIYLPSSRPLYWANRRLFQSAN